MRQISVSGRKVRLRCPAWASFECYDRSVNDQEECICGQ